MVVHNEDNSQTAGFSTGSLETDINEDSTPHISIIYMGDVNKTYGILNNETNDVIVTPDVKVCVKSKQSENLSANSSRRIYVDHGTYKYNSNEVNIRTGSKIQKNSDKNVNSKDNNDVTEQIKRAQYSLENPPDGGWGWVVTISAFMVAVILDGISFSFGLFFKELYVYFNESKTLTSWISSVFNGSYLGIGPIASGLVAVFGCRKVAIFGAILASISLFNSTWSPNVWVMIILYGLIGGALSDITGNYIGAFYLAGATILLAGIMCLPLRRITKWEYNKNCRMGVYKNAIDLSSDDSCKLNANKR